MIDSNDSNYRELCTHQSISTPPKHPLTLQKRYDAMFSSPRVAINHLCDYAMMEGWSDTRMRLPYDLSLSFEIENSQFATQMQEANSLAIDFVNLIGQLHEKYGDTALKPTFGSRIKK